MVPPALDTSKKWFFHFASLVPNAIPIKIEEKTGVATFDIHITPQRKITIELLSFNEEEQIIEGKYTVGPVGDKENVVFEILESGKLIGHPKGSLVRDVWMLTSK